MKKIIILIPVFNDWDSLDKLLGEIDETIKNIKNISIKCLIVNDASTIMPPKLVKPKNIKKIYILDMIENRGHARCNAFGIRYVNENEDFDNLILMDGDGEDRPIELKSLLEKIIKNPKTSVVAKRIKRSEGPFFQFLYFMHKIITLTFTGQKVNFGNYSCLTKNDVSKLSSKASLWSSYSGTFKKNIKDFNEINSTRGNRYFGPSKMSLFNLLIHSFSIIAVFRFQVLIRSFLIIILLGYINKFFVLNLIYLQIVVILFCIIIFLASLRENEKELFKSSENLKNIKEITH
tara:strand:+ start:1056 stop:1928 length:873 start_codon:yes stop_codon:yes gene_type:complete